MAAVVVSELSGALQMICESDALLISHTSPPIITLFSATVFPKPVPVRVTSVPPSEPEIQLSVITIILRMKQDENTYRYKDKQDKDHARRT